MRGISKLVWAALFICMITASVSAYNDMDRRIGIVYMKNAAAYYLNGQYRQAEEFLEKAKEFYTDSSDYEYIKGLIKLESKNDLNAAAENFRDAVEFDNWILLERKECITDYARILFRKKQYDELITLVENNAYPDFKDNDLMYLYLLSLKYRKQDVKYRDILGLSINRYHDDYRFGLLYVNESSLYRNKILNGEYVFKNEEGRLQVYLESVKNLEDGTRKITALEQYFSMGGKDLSAKIEYMRLTGETDEGKIQELISANLLSNPFNRLRLINILPQNELRKVVENAYTEYTGNIYYDLNNDGYFEELHLYENGKPAGISIDNNQDGVIEVMIIFEKGQPLELILTTDKFIRFSYDGYPVLQEMSIADENGNTVYTFIKERMALPVYSFREYDDKLMFDNDIVNDFTNDMETVSKNSVRIAVYSGAGITNGWGDLKEELERRDENTAILKIYNNLMGNYIYKQFKDKKTIGFGDIDFDNIIDLREIYSDGELVSIEADDNKNGRYDYKISFEDEQIVSWWDFNEDGIYDCRQYEKNGVLINEYSSGFDGNFDIIERN